MGRILVIRGGAVGDFILTLPAIELLRTQLEKPHLEILGYPAITELATAFGFADATRSIERGPMAGFFVPDGDLVREWQCYFSDFDLIVSYLYDPDGYFHANLERAGARSVIQASHRIDETLGFPAAAQLAKPLEQIALYPDRNYVSLNLERSADSKRIAIHPGSGSPQKNWGYENWAAVAKSLHQKEPDTEYLIISGEAESENIGEFLELLSDAKLPFEHLQGAPLPEVARRLAQCSQFLGHDSGISHLAAACELPATLIFGPTRSNIWAPQNPGVQVIEAPEGRMDLVTVEMVAKPASS